MRNIKTCKYFGPDPILPHQVQGIIFFLVPFCFVAVCLVSLAMAPFSYDAKRTFGIVDLMVLMTISAVAITLLLRSDIEFIQALYLAPWIYLVVMATYGVTFLIRRWVKLN